MISEPRLRRRIRQAVRGYVRAWDSVEAYSDLHEQLEIDSQTHVPTKKAVMIAENAENYHRKRIASRDAYTRLATLVSLYKRAFPDGPLSENPEFREKLKGFRRHEQESLEKLMGLINELTSLSLMEDP